MSTPNFRNGRNSGTRCKRRTKYELDSDVVANDVKNFALNESSLKNSHVLNRFELQTQFKRPN